MKNIFYKTSRDIRKVFSPLLANLLLTGSFISLIARYLQGGKLPLSDILYFIIFYNWIWNNIHSE